ncbi:putative UDP-glucose flavonoid 3-O-glucosyltransferase 3 [Miscanthus floridulus]|uniref:putative UDP-glucose flavonoid 3-O-glucosyltransferase 3 n=1 Tax=Miscanthus floridulus TaxID=154761 RepID=UPI003458A6C9
MVNRVTQLEPGLLAAIAEGRCVPPLYPIGPVLNLGVKDASDDEACVRGSTLVVFLCFASLGWFDAAKARKVAAGLERSGHRFLWALHGPPAASSRHPSDADLES